MAAIGGNRTSTFIMGLVFTAAGLGLVAVGVYQMTHLGPSEGAADAIAYLMLPLTGIAAIAGGVGQFGLSRDISRQDKNRED